MKHFGEILQTLGARQCDVLESNEYWDFWKAEYQTPVSTVQGFYLYCKHRCPKKEASSENLLRWRDLSAAGVYEIVVTPKSDLSLDLASTKSAFRGVKCRTSDDLLYENFLKDLKPKSKASEQLEVYIDPSLQLEDGTIQANAVDFLANWLLPKDAKNTKTKAGNLGVLIADGGLGKTTLTRKLCAKLSDKDKRIIPVLIESDQWRHLVESTFKLDTLWNAALSEILERATGLLSNETAFRVLVQEGLFIIVFDGFDEVCSSPSVYHKPHEIIEELTRLVTSEDDEDIQARILLTSRETFWNSIQEEIQEIPVDRFRLKGFDNEQRKSYFEHRLSDTGQRDLANRIARSLSQAFYGIVSEPQANEDKPSGVPFILDLVVDYVRQCPEENSSQYADPYAPGLWEHFLEGMCRRDNTRQTLDVAPDKQLFAFQELFRDHESDISKADLRFYFETYCEVTDQKMLDRFENHMLLSRVSKDVFKAKHEPLRIYFLARYLATELAKATDGNASAIVKLLSRNSAGHTPVIDWLVGQLKRNGPEKARAAVRHALALVAVAQEAKQRQESSLALFYLIQKLIEEVEKKQRTAALLNYYEPRFGGDHATVKGAYCGGLVSGFDFGGITFVECTFISVEFKNCVFNENTIFNSCRFEGNVQFSNCLGSKDIKIEKSRYSREAEFALNKIQGTSSRKELKMAFAEEVLRKSLRKFRSGDSGFGSIQYQRRNSGFQPGNPTNDTIWDALLRHGIVDKHHISNVDGGGLHIVENKDIRREVLAYLDNSILGVTLKQVIESAIS